jgi:GTPase SAR1 family protein
MDEVAKADRNGDLVIADAVLQGGSGSRPIVVIGDVGVGKTSFFENLYEKLEQSEKANTLFLHINLGIKANLSIDVKAYVLAEIPASLKQRYAIDIDSDNFAHAVYYNDLNDFDRGVKGALKNVDPLAYRKARIDFLAGLVARRDTHLHRAIQCWS